MQLWATSSVPAVFTLLCGQTTFHRGKERKEYISVSHCGGGGSALGNWIYVSESQEQPKKEESTLSEP